MSNGSGQSRAPYIIICGGRIAATASQSPSDKDIQMLKAASDVAVYLTTYYGAALTAEQSGPISDLQHSIMDNMETWSRDEAVQAKEDMFALLDDLEDEMA